MSIKDFFNKWKFWNKESSDNNEVSLDSFERINKEKTKSSILNKMFIKFVGFINTDQRDVFVSSRWDLNEIKAASNTDSYIKIALQKYSQLIFKAGYYIISKNDSAAEYIKSRFRLMSYLTGTPMDIVLQEIVEDLFKYSNAFLIKTRVKQEKLLGVKAKGLAGKDPVGAYFRVDPTSVKIKRDKHGTVVQYLQTVGGEEKKFAASEVVHFFLDREGDSPYGTPRLIATLEDIKMLRKIEGSVLKLIYRFSLPLYQVKVGLAEAGMQATDKDIEDTRRTIEGMAEDGALITSERVAVSIVGSEGHALDASGYLTYFEKRVITALNMSEAMMGRGGTKQDANSMEAQIHDTVRHVQRIASIFIEASIINELLLEGGFNPIQNEKDMVYFDFEEINNETKVKMETHAINMFQSNAITFDEMRTELGRRADNVDINDLFVNKIQIPKISAQTTAKTNSDNSTEPNDAVNNIIQPTNQHGRTTAKIKESVSEKNVNKYKKKYQDVYKKYQEARNDICERNIDTNFILPLISDSIISLLNEKTYLAALSGAELAMKDCKKTIVMQTVNTVLIDNKVKKVVTELFKDIKSKIKKDMTVSEKMNIFDSMEYRMRFLCEHIIPKSYWYSYVKTCNFCGIQEVKIIFNSEEDKKDRKEIISTNAFTLDDIPAFHPYCKCKIIVKAGD